MRERIEPYGIALRGICIESLEKALGRSEKASLFGLEGMLRDAARLQLAAN